MSSTDLSGTIVGYQYYYPSLGSPDNEFFHGSQFVEGPGLEIVPPNGQPFIVDFSASDFVIQFNESFNWNAAAFNGIAFTFSSNAPFLKGVQLVNDTVFGFTSSNVSFDSSHIYVNWQGLHVNTNNILQFHLTFDQAPVAVDDSAAVAAGQVVSSNVLANDSDPESETITVQPQSVSGQYGSLTLNSDGTYSYTADNAASLKANETAHDNFSYTISDPEGLTSTATLSIAVTGSNDAPVVHGVADQQTSLPSWYYKLPNNEFIDPDGDALTYSATLANGDALPSWLAFDSVTRAFTGVPPSGFNGSLDLKVTASDGTLSSSDTFHVSFSGPAQAAPNITAVDPTNTTADVVHYLVTFQGPVTGVDTSDFLLTTSGN